MRIAEVELLPYERKRRTAHPPRSPAVYFEALEKLATILDGVPWMLGGGLCVPLSLGEFYRSHFDLDIVVPFDALGRLDRAMRRADYRLTTRFLVSWKSRGVVLQVGTRATSPLLRWRCKRLAFVASRGGEGMASLLRKIDAYPFRLRNGCLETCDYGHRVEASVPVVGRQLTLPSGRTLSCFHLHYVEQLKRLRGGVVHRLDRTAIERGPDAARDLFFREEAAAASGGEICDGR